MAIDSQILGTDAAELLPHLVDALELENPQINKLLERVYCFSFKVRLPRKDDRSCNRTPYFERWNTDDTSYLTTEDPKYATEIQCQEIAAMLLAQLFEIQDIECDLNSIPSLSSVLGRDPIPNSLLCKYTNEIISVEDIRLALSYSTQRLGSYDIPTTYNVELNEGGLHRADNVTWMKPIHIIYRLRRTLKEQLLNNGATARAAKNALDKIQVKAYCTDKNTMPPHFSNRDIRWATWHDSAQFASHYECSMIELELMSQLFEFQHAPLLPVDLSDEIFEIRDIAVEPNSRQCFITGKIMDFNGYLEGAINPRGGRSAYQVGHILPLTREGLHAWRNVAWVSDDGNRIQGNNTVDEIETKLIEAVVFHLKRDIANGSKNINEKVASLIDIINELENS